MPGRNVRKKPKVAAEKLRDRTPSSPTPSTLKPIVTRKPAAPKEWRFSFQDWRQIEFFEIGGVDKSWFVGLLERLARLSNEPMAPYFDGSGTGAGRGLRFHPINWDQTNCPIKRSDLNWLDQDILGNPDEFEMFQFSVSQSLGRIVGYVNDKVFFIVLLDPAHNIQPSQKFSYRVDKTHPGHCHLSRALEVSRRVSTSLKEMGGDCLRLADELDRVESNALTPNALLHFVSDAQLEEFNECADTNSVTLVELLEYGVMYFQESK